MTQETFFLPKIVDSREPQDIRTRMLEFGWMQKALSSGDYSFLSIDKKKIGIERKTVDDLFQSLNSILNEQTGDRKPGRLSVQLENMKDEYDFPILLIEGNWKVIANNKIVSPRGIEQSSWNMIWNYIQSQQHKGILIQITLSIEHTIQRINELYAWYQQPFHSGGLSRNSYSDDRILAFPSGCRGKSAKNVLDIFKCLQAIANAEEEDFLNVEGIGEKKAKLIFEHFHRGLDLNTIKLIKKDI
jgi:ERCC4-type nuclease